MILSSIVDPDVFSAERCKDSTYNALAMERLQRMAHNHLLVFDRDETGDSCIGKELIKLAATNPAIEARLNAIVGVDRILRVPVSSEERAAYHELLDSESSSAAIALSQSEKTDLILGDDYLREVMNEHGLSDEKFVSLTNYHASRFAEIEGFFAGGVPVGGMTKNDFVEKVLEPLLKHADQLTVLDRYVSNAAFNFDDEGCCGSPSKNWPDFHATIKQVFKVWSRHHTGNGEFQLISDYHRKRETVLNGKTLSPNQVARELAQRLGIAKPGVHIRLKRLRTEKQLKDLSHDRYFVTNHGFVLGLTKGFDLLKRNDRCGAADIYIRRRPTQSDPLDKILRPGGNVGICRY